MHLINEFTTLQRRQLIRDCVFSALSGFASGGNHGPIEIERLFLRAADCLAEAALVERPESSSGPGTVHFSSLMHEKRTELFPDYNMPEFFAQIIRFTLWDLLVQRVLAPAPVDKVTRSLGEPNHFLHLDAVMITPYGVSVLTGLQDRIRVHDPEGYLVNFSNSTRPADLEMMRYVREAIAVFGNHHLLACIVLLGAASERLVDVLANALRSAQGSPKGDNWYNQKYKNKNLSDRFQAVAGKLMGEYGEDLAAEDLKEPFQQIITLTFHTIRRARNDIAHPNEAHFTQNEVAGMLHHFVQYFKYVYRIIAFLNRNASP